MVGPAQHLTTAELLFASGDRHHELVRGVVRVSEPPGGAHGWIAARITHRLGSHVEQHGLGTVLVEAGYVLRRDPDTVRAPDVSFISAARLPPEQIPEQFIPGAPDLAIEILSPGDRWPDVEERLADYFAGGTRIAWVVEPRQQRVIVRYPDGASKILTGSDVLDGEDVVPGFRCPVTEVFGSGGG